MIILVHTGHCSATILSQVITGSSMLSADVLLLHAPNSAFASLISLSIEASTGKVWCCCRKGCLLCLWIHPAGIHSYNDTLIIVRAIQKWHTRVNQDSPEMDLDQALLEKRVSLGCGSEGTAQQLLNPESFLQHSENQHCGIEQGAVNRSGHWSGSRKQLKFRFIFPTCIHVKGNEVANKLSTSVKQGLCFSLFSMLIGQTLLLVDFLIADIITAIDSD